MTLPDELNPAERKRQAIIDGATALFRELIGEHIDEAIRDAQEALIDDEEQTEPTVKLSFAVAFKPMDDAPEIGVKVAWSVRRKHEATMQIDPRQQSLDLPIRKEDLT